MVLNLCTSSDDCNICTKFQENVSKGFRVIVRADAICILKFAKGHNSVKKLMELWYLFYPQCLIMLYICTNFCQESHRVSELWTRTVGSTLGWLQMLTDEKTNVHTIRRKTVSLYRAVPEAGATTMYFFYFYIS